MGVTSGVSESHGDLVPGRRHRDATNHDDGIMVLVRTYHRRRGYNSVGVSSRLPVPDEERKEGSTTAVSINARPMLNE